MLKHNLGHDLDINRKAISPYLAGEIVNRYYFNRGEIINSLREDVVVDSALSVLGGPRYAEILKKTK